MRPLRKRVLSPKRVKLRTFRPNWPIVTSIESVSQSVSQSVYLYRSSWFACCRSNLGFDVNYSWARWGQLVAPVWAWPVWATKFTALPVSDVCREKEGEREREGVCDLNLEFMNLLWSNPILVAKFACVCCGQLNVAFIRCVTKWEARQRGGKGEESNRVKIEWRRRWRWRCVGSYVKGSQ